MELIKEYWTERAALLGYSGTAGFWITQNFQTVLGIVLSTAMVVSSIILYAIKIRSALNGEKREQEEHDYKMNKKNK